MLRQGLMANSTTRSSAIEAQGTMWTIVKLAGATPTPAIRARWQSPTPMRTAATSTLMRLVGKMAREPSYDALTKEKTREKAVDSVDSWRVIAE